MRNVILLHARADAALAEEVVSRNPRVALVSGVDRRTPPGRFGEQFHMAALWSREAALDGLEWVFAQALSGRERPSVILVVDGVPLPACLAAAGRQVRVSAMTDIFAVFDSITPRAEVAEDPLLDVATGSRRRAVATAASAALSIGCGALLAHAASPYGLIPSVATPSFTPTARTAVVDPAAAVPETLPVIEAVEARFEAVRSSASDVAASPIVQARFERVKSIAVSDLLLAQLAQRADEQAQSLLSAPKPSAPVAAVDVAPVRLAAVIDSAPLVMVASAAVSDRSTF